MASGHAAEPPVEVLYRRYARDVFALAYHAAGSRSEAEDLSQTTFLNAHRALLGGAQPENERAWLLTIARNACCSRFRALARRPREEPLDDSVLSSRTSVDESPASVVEALEALPPKHRRALLLHAEGCTAADIGELYGLTAAAADALVVRARAALREVLAEGAEPYDCARTGELVRHQLAHELPSHDQAVLRAHLRICEPCAKTARRLRARRRLASLLLLPWELLTRVGGLFGGGGAGGVKAASVLGALAIGTTAAIHPGGPTPRTAEPAREATIVPRVATLTPAPELAGSAAAREPTRQRTVARGGSASTRVLTPQPQAPVAPAPAGPARTPPAGGTTSAAPSAAPTPGAHAPASTPLDAPVATPQHTSLAGVVQEPLGTVTQTVGEVAAALPELPPLLPPLPQAPDASELPAALPQLPAPPLPLPETQPLKPLG
jgi:RNA polymerase sigma-70 factor (ECF subfamily)